MIWFSLKLTVLICNSTFCWLPLKFWMIGLFSQFQTWQMHSQCKYCMHHCQNLNMYKCRFFHQKKLLLFFCKFFSNGNFSIFLRCTQQCRRKGSEMCDNFVTTFISSLLLPARSRESPISQMLAALWEVCLFQRIYFHSLWNWVWKNFALKWLKLIETWPIAYLI